MTAPNRFNLSSLFQGNRWNGFSLVAAAVGLWIVVPPFLAAYASSSWWALAGWGFLIILFLDTFRAASLRLWRNRKASSRGGDPNGLSG